MSARLWMESIRLDVLEMIRLENGITMIENLAGPHGQSSGGGRGGKADGMRGIDHLVDSGMREELERMRRKVNLRIEEALHVLYGKSGRGGLAKAKSELDAEILCC